MKRTSIKRLYKRVDGWEPERPAVPLKGMNRPSCKCNATDLSHFIVLSSQDGLYYLST
jgi:hypothetical protein